MATLYLDCFAGVSGDMLVGALLDCGVELSTLKAELSKLDLPGYRLRVSRVDRSGISATKFDVDVEDADTNSAGVPAAHGEPGQPSSEPAHPHVHSHVHSHSHSHEHPGVHEHDRETASAHEHTHPHSHPNEDTAGHNHAHDHAHRPLSTIMDLIARSSLSASVKLRATQIFRRLGEAEARVHNVPIESIQFHEVGAVDSIIDIVASAICLELLHVDRVICSPLHIGTGTFNCAHGTYPVPGPATSELLRGVPVYATEIRGELVTPTGAAIVTSVATSFGSLKQFVIAATGYGAGTRQYERFPNVLRVFLGTDATTAAATEIVVIETNIDDLNPQLFGYVLERLLEAGALDVFYTPVHMKKNRPGILLTVLARPEDQSQLTAILFAETSTIGVRYRSEQRDVLERHHVTVETPYGEIRIKVAVDTARKHVNESPEFEDCVSAARRHDVALRDVQMAALTAYRDLQQDSR